MSQTLQRGEIVLASDPYNDSGQRPVVIISDETYPFYPHGYLGLPITTRDKPNTHQIYDHDKEQINEPLDVDPSYVNPFSPTQVNNSSKTIMHLSDNFCDILAEKAAGAMGIQTE